MNHLLRDRRSARNLDPVSAEDQHDLRVMDRRKPVSLGYPVRLMFYSIFAMAICHLVSLGVHHRGIESVAHENGIIEQTQVLLALMTCMCLFYAANRAPLGRHFLILCGCLVGYAAARECDSWFETVFFDDAYKYIAGIPLLGIGLSTLYRGRMTIIDQVAELLPTPALTLFAFAGIYICSVCQVIDHTNLWSEIGTDSTAIMTKAGVEEFAELFGYLVLAFSGIETLSMTWPSAKAASPLAADHEQSSFLSQCHLSQPLVTIPVMTHLTDLPPAKSVSI